MFLNDFVVIIEVCKFVDFDSSWIVKLLVKGLEKCVEKFGEEVIEVVIEVVKGDCDKLIGEVVDSFYYLLVMCVVWDVMFVDIEVEFDCCIV